MDRPSRYAGSWYLGDAALLRREVGALLSERREPPRAVLGTIAPHAGYRFSGSTAAAVYAGCVVPDEVILLGFSHRPAAAGLHLWPAPGHWETPLGAVPVDEELTAALAASAAAPLVDPAPQAHEHCLELQLPFLQMRNPALRIAVLSVDCHDGPALAALGRALAEVVRARPGPVLLAATTDMSHESGRPNPAAFVRAQDARALAAIEALDLDALLAARTRHHVTMCGVAPVGALLAAARALGATRAEVVCYRTSDDAVQGGDRVVGYAGVHVPAAPPAA